MARLPSTTAHLRVLQQSFSEQMVEGEVAAGGFRWNFAGTSTAANWWWSHHWGER